MVSSSPEGDVRPIRTTLVTTRYILGAALRMTLSALGPVIPVPSLAQVVDCDLLIVEVPEYTPEAFRAVAASGKRALIWCATGSAELGMMATDAGVLGLLADDSTERQIVAAAKAVAAGELWIPETSEPDAPAPRPSSLKLTPRESQLVTLLCRGLRNREIAQEMNVTEGTIKVYLSRLFEKTGVRDRFELTMLTFRNNGMLVPARKPSVRAGRVATEFGSLEAPPEAPQRLPS